MDEMDDMGYRVDDLLFCLTTQLLYNKTYFLLVFSVTSCHDNKHTSCQLDQCLVK